MIEVYNLDIRQSYNRERIAQFCLWPTPWITFGLFYDYKRIYCAFMPHCVHASKKI